MKDIKLNIIYSSIAADEISSLPIDTQDLIQNYFENLSNHPEAAKFNTQILNKNFYLVRIKKNIRAIFSIEDETIFITEIIGNTSKDYTYKNKLKEYYPDDSIKKDVISKEIEQLKVELNNIEIDKIELENKILKNSEKQVKLRYYLIATLSSLTTIAIAILSQNSNILISLMICLVIALLYILKKNFIK